MTPAPIRDATPATTYAHYSATARTSVSNILQHRSHTTLRHHDYQRQYQRYGRPEAPSLSRERQAHCDRIRSDSGNGPVELLDGLLELTENPKLSRLLTHVLAHDIRRWDMHLLFFLAELCAMTKARNYWTEDVLVKAVNREDRGNARGLTYKDAYQAVRLQAQNILTRAELTQQFLENVTQADFTRMQAYATGTTYFPEELQDAIGATEDDDQSDSVMEWNDREVWQVLPKARREQNLPPAHLEASAESASIQTPQHHPMASVDSNSAPNGSTYDMLHGIHSPGVSAHVATTPSPGNQAHDLSPTYATTPSNSVQKRARDQCSENAENRSNGASEYGGGYHQDGDCQGGRPNKRQRLF